MGAYLNTESGGGGVGFDLVSGGLLGQGSNAESDEAATIRDKQAGVCRSTRGYRYILAVSSTFGFVFGWSLWVVDRVE